MKTKYSIVVLFVLNIFLFSCNKDEPIDEVNNLEEEIIKTATVTTFAGSIGGFEDNVGSLAKFNRPTGLAMDHQGNLYVADRLNHKIRKILPNGEVLTFAGSTQGNTDGTGATAQFFSPDDLAFDSQGNLYVADRFNHKIRKITTSGLVTTLAGSTIGFTDGVGTDAKFNNPIGVAVDSHDNIFVSDFGNHKIRKITPSGKVTTFVGNTVGFQDGIGTYAKFKYPGKLAIDIYDNIYVADYNNYKIRKITPNGEVTTIAGTVQGEKDGISTVAQFNKPLGIAVDTKANIYVTDYYGHNIRKITNGNVTTIAGEIQGYIDGVGLEAKFNYPGAIIVATNGILYVADNYNHKIRKIVLE